MRQIKFRAFNPTDNIMYYQSDGLRLKLNHDGGVSVMLLKQDAFKCKLMQWTGLKDKNGKEIYSDDVLLYADGLLYQVVWHNQLASFGLKHPDGVRFIKFYGEGYSTEDMTIKGNIYENPDLLK